MAYNCMLGAFTKPGLNLMGNDDLIFDSHDDYNGPALWKTSTYSFIVYIYIQKTPGPVLDILPSTGTLSIYKH